MKLGTLYKRGFVIGFASALYTFILWLGYWSALLVVPCALGAIAAAYVCRKMANERIKWELTSALAEQQLQKQKDGRGVLLESFTMGWFNLVLQALWSPILEKHIAGLTGDLLQKVLNEVREKNSSKAPWKFLEAIVLEELRFGAVPPSFQNTLAKYDPAASLLTITMDVKFTSNSAQAVMLVRTKVLPVVSTAFNVRLEATYVQFSGRLHLGLLLGPEPPGIKGIYYSFATKPDLDIAVRPLGMALPPELIALTGALQGVLQKIISRRMVEPQRRFFDMHRMYMNRHITRVGGPGGLLRVVIHTAKHLVPNTSSSKSDPSNNSSSSSIADPAAAAAKVSRYDQIAAKFAAAKAGNKKPGSIATFCELKYNHQVMRTPVAHHAAAGTAVWEWQLSLALPADLAAAAAVGSAAQGNSPAARSAGSGGSGGSAAGKGAAAAAAGSADVCLLAVYEAQSLGDPVLLGKCKIYLSPLSLKPNGDPQDLTLPLQGANWPNATVTLSLTWLKSTRPVQQRQKWQPQSECVYQPQQQQQQQQQGQSRTQSDASGVSLHSPQQQQQQQQQQHTRTQSDASVVSLHAHHHHQQQQGHSRNESHQSVSALGVISTSGANPGASSTSGGGATGGVAAAAAAAAAAGGHKSVSWTDQGEAGPPPRLEIPPAPVARESTTSIQQQQQQASPIGDPSRRVSKSAGNSPTGDQQSKQQQMPYQRTNSSHRRSITVDLGTAAVAAAGSRSAAATPRGSGVTGYPQAAAGTPRAAAMTPAAASPVPGDRSGRVTRSEGGGPLPAAAARSPLFDLAAAAADGISRPSRASQQQQQQHGGVEDPEYQDSLSGNIPKRRNWLSGTSLSGWGSWIGLSAAAGSGSSSTMLDAAAAVARSGSADSGLDVGLNDAAAAAAADNPAAATVVPAKAASSSNNGSTAAAAAAGSDLFSSPLTMLASVVQLQKQVELQQQHMRALQQQLAAVSSRHIKQQQQCRQNARSALLKGARFIMHNSDGSQQPVLLYLTPQHPSLISAAAAAAAAGRKGKSSRLLFGSSDKASREGSFGSSITQQQQQQHGTPSVVSSKSGRSTPESVQQQDLEYQQQQQLHGSSNERYLVIAALPADGEGFRAAAKRRIAAVLSHTGTAAAAAANSSGGGAAASAAGRGSPGSSSGGRAPAAAIAAGFSRHERRLLSHVGAYESGEIVRHDLPVITVIPVSQITEVHLVPSNAAAIDHEDTRTTSGPADDRSNRSGSNSQGTALNNAEDMLEDPDSDPSSLLITLRNQQLDIGAKEGVVEDQITIELQVPAFGNGRSGSEWLFALQQLQDKPVDSAVVRVEHV